MSLRRNSRYFRDPMRFARGSFAIVSVVAISLLVQALDFSSSPAVTEKNTGPHQIASSVRPASQTVENFPFGIADSAHPSGLAPPGPLDLPHYVLRYQNDFNGQGIPKGWNVFTGVPGGDPGGQFAASHVVVQRGTLLLETYKDPHFGNRWVTGGLCQCGRAVTYGAYFVRSKMSGAGPNQVELLWPASNTWPPEVDFNETGGHSNSTTASLHWSSRNHVIRDSISLDMTKWHTWGVVWTRSSVTYVVDGRVWSSVHNASEVPHVRMRLDFEQRTMCDLHRQCPSVPVTMSIDWVAEYSPV